MLLWGITLFVSSQNWACFFFLKCNPLTCNYFLKTSLCRKKSGCGQKSNGWISQTKHTEISYCTLNHLVTILTSKLYVLTVLSRLFFYVNKTAKSTYKTTKPQIMLKAALTNSQSLVNYLEISITMYNTSLYYLLILKDCFHSWFLWILSQIWWHTCVLCT